jgi:hypothetical protein
MEDINTPYIKTKKIRLMNASELREYKNDKQKKARRLFTIEKTNKLILLNTEKIDQKEEFILTKINNLEETQKQILVNSSKILTLLSNNENHNENHIPEKNGLQKIVSKKNEIDVAKEIEKYFNFAPLIDGNGRIFSKNLEHNMFIQKYLSVDHSTYVDNILKFNRIKGKLKCPCVIKKEKDGEGLIHNFNLSKCSNKYTINHFLLFDEKTRSFCIGINGFFLFFYF